MLDWIITLSCFGIKIIHEDI